MSKINDAVQAVTKKCGGDLVATMCNAFGAVDGTVTTVPQDRVNGLAAALTKIANGGGMSMAMASRAAHGDYTSRSDSPAKTFADIRREAYGTDDDEDAPKPKTLAEIRVQAFANWNRKREESNG